MIVLMVGEIQTVLSYYQAMSYSSVLWRSVDPNTFFDELNNNWIVKFKIERFYMSFETITIVRQFPVINGFVQLPDNYIRNRTSVPVKDFLATTGADLVKIQHTGGARIAGSKHGVQEIVELDPLEVVCCGADTAAQDAKLHYGTAQPTTPRPLETDIQYPRDPYETDDDVPPNCECTDQIGNMILNVTLTDTINANQCDCATTLLKGSYGVYPASGWQGEPGYPDVPCTWYGLYENYMIIIAYDRKNCWSMTIYCNARNAETGMAIWYGTNAGSESPIGTFTVVGDSCVNMTTITVAQAFPN
jgi:hypothetical protein